MAVGQDFPFRLLLTIIKKDTLYEQISQDIDDYLRHNRRMHRMQKPVIFE